MLKIQHIIRLLAISAVAVSLCSANPAAGAGKAPWVGKTFWGAPCKGFHGTTGTYDYLQRARHQGALDLVEEHHFSEGVETLRKGITTEPIGDIDFVLRTFPNHHRALYSAMNYRLRYRKWPKSSKGMPAECYYQRAAKFSPNDLTVYRQYSILQHKFGKHKEALATHKTINRLHPGNEVLQYNMALTMVELKQYKAANAIAEEVYGKGFPLPGLRKKLKRAGHWEVKVKAEAKGSGEAVAETAKAKGSGEAVVETAESVEGETEASEESVVQESNAEATPESVTDATEEPASNASNTSTDIAAKDDDVSDVQAATDIAVTERSAGTKSVPSPKTEAPAEDTVFDFSKSSPESASSEERVDPAIAGQ